jgi:hypothetical protein
MDEHEQAKKEYRRRMRYALAMIRGDLRGNLLPYIRRLEKSGEPDQILEAQSLRLHAQHTIENLRALVAGEPIPWPEDMLDDEKGGE